MSRSLDDCTRALSITQLEQKQFNVMAFEGVWLASLGCPELTGMWIVYGNPKNGKTRYCLQLAKHLTNFGRVAYNSLEEGVSETLKRAIIATNFTPKEKKRILLLHKERMDQLRNRLLKPKSPNIIFIDSLQYTDMSFKDIIKLKDEFQTKLFIFISHAEGNLPAGPVARRVQFGSNIYIRVEAFKAYPTGRYGGGEEYVIWEDGALKVN